MKQTRQTVTDELQRIFCKTIKLTKSKKKEYNSTEDQVTFHFSFTLLTNAEARCRTYLVSALIGPGHVIPTNQL